MLPLMLMLVTGPQTPPPAAPPPPASSVRTIDPEGMLRGLVGPNDGARQDCRNGEFHQAGDSAAAVQRNGRVSAGDLMFRQGDPVSLTLLLERRVGQCSVPISYDLTTPEGRLPSFPARQ
jgi:hypothetical protein